jgi:lycopene cyclase domain-containing protein
MENLYLWLDVFTISGPLILSFDKKVAFWRYWGRLFPAIAVMMAGFIPWDIAFTEHGFWGFNPEYLSGIWLAGLPLEEWLFFVVVPYACVFIYACLNAYFPRWGSNAVLARRVGIILGFALVVIGTIHYTHWYTFLAFSLSGALLLGVSMFWKPVWLGKFLNAYVICLVPFLMVNGVLTGTGISEQVVWYKDAENLGLRLVTIPLDDFAYNLLMLLMVVSVMEAFRSRTMVE